MPIFFKRLPSNVIISLLAATLIIGYPFAVLQYFDDIQPYWFASILFLIFTVRFFLIKKKNNGDFLLFGIIATFCLSIALFESQQLLKLYPVLMNISIGFTFLFSLTDDRCLIERLVILGGKNPPPQAYNYLRKLTLLWGVLLLINGIISAYTAWYTSLSAWAFYNGILSYILLASFAVGEWLYRISYKKKHNIIDD